MHFLIVEDHPEYKVEFVINYLKDKKLNFTYEICKSVNSGLRYFVFNKDKIDLIILDLGLPIFDDNSRYDKYAGLDIIDEICIEKNIKNIPIIINSTTNIKLTDKDIDEKEYFELHYGSDVVIEHVERLTGETLLDFISKHLKDKI